jgi:hypothetical protein
MACIRPVTCYGCEAWAYTYKSKIQKLQMVQNKCLRIIRKYLITNGNVLHTDFSVLKLDEYLQLLAKNTPEKNDIHPNEVMRQLCVNLYFKTLLTFIKKNYGVNIGMQRNEEVRVPKNTRRSMGHIKEINMGKSHIKRRQNLYI